MRKLLNRSNEYFDTYNLYDEKGKFVGMLEDHLHHVEKRYFVGWHNYGGVRSIAGFVYVNDEWETKAFDTEEEAIAYALKGDRE